MKVLTSNLVGVQLDWAVAQCEGIKFQNGYYYKPATEKLAAWNVGLWSPSTDWAQGGPIIDREKISITTSIVVGDWVAYVKGRSPVIAKTALIAAMRAFVASKLGEEVYIPMELA